MSGSFLKELKKPFLILAPMANVTDAAFRRMFAKYGKPDITYTEFVSADGLMRADDEGRAKLLRDLLYAEAERPIVAQVFTSDPEAMEYAVRLVHGLGFDGVDINMGCPDLSVEKQGAGAALIKTPERAVALIEAAKRGAGDMPVLVKTRLGYNKDVLEEWLPKLLSAEPAVITVHARTRKEMSNVPARWERVARAVQIRDALKSKTLIAGNGDVQSVEDARSKAAQTGADGVMIGRGVFGSPWFFRGGEIPPLDVRLRIAVEHAKLFEELLGDVKNFAHMKKHFKAYVDGFRGAKALRMRLMETESVSEAEQIIEDFLRNLQK